MVMVRHHNNGFYHS